MIQIKGIICFLLLSAVSVELPAFSMESPSIPGMFVGDSVPQKKVKRYIAWVDRMVLPAPGSGRGATGERCGE
jgi:polynucleotide 5'-kinase involved in rRNA processing